MQAPHPPLVDHSIWQDAIYVDPFGSGTIDLTIGIDDHFEHVSESHSSNLSIADNTISEHTQADAAYYPASLGENEDRPLSQTLINPDLPIEENTEAQVEAAATPSSPVSQDVNNLPATVIVSTALQRILSNPLPFIVDGIQTRTERKLFDYYHKVVTDVLLLKTPRNPLAVALIPKALSDTTHTALLDAIMCLAASQYQRATANTGSNLQATESESVESLKWARHCKAAQHHVQQLGQLSTGSANTSRPSADERQLLALTMILYQFSLCESNSQQTRSVYLSIARELVCQIYKDGVYEPELHNDLDSFILDWFYFHDTCSSLTRPFQVPCIDIHHGTLHRFNLALPASSLARYCKETKQRRDEIVLVGTWDGLLQILSRIIQLRRRSSESSGPASVETLTKGIDIEGDLREWEYEYSDPENAIVAQCYRNAAFILLWFTMHPDSSITHAKVQAALASSLELLQDLGHSAHAQTCLLLPLFVFGVSTTRKDFQQLIELKIQRLAEWTALSNISEVVVFLRDWWQYVDSLGGSASSWWDWEVYLVTNGYELVLV